MMFRILRRKTLDKLIGYAENRGYVKRASEDALKERLRGLEKHDYTIANAVLEGGRIIAENMIEEL